mmetsp:Transcript_41662/g.69322  ORF Transcript_41662/g.69322 Transcript_41662/m.69322 type:complete len:324 (-) Transcript_41662:407-1378(-)|eukprot:CAMPEP_0119306640 /NCGR_PEP_ID=MMETSP1333-20130426/7345_1 /TAXON_ID=418940 /ORGANISM="Scyphosphaera apsteinii, Strain RCC1455" /LENGTH=323 /DNA_ID=CAMNT_0007309993 /DNA_START=14 /DNA_END=985 /DNA_ORIENTATION=-
MLIWLRVAAGCTHLTLCLAAQTYAPATSERPSSLLHHVALAGAISCSFTHSMVVPLDVMKTRLQSDSSLRGPRTALRCILQNRGYGALLHGLRPTAVGYFLQGAAKFGGYETLKRFGQQRILDLTSSDELPRFTKLPVMLLSAATAELAATAVLCPLEVIKLRVQTDTALAAKGLVPTLLHLVRSDGCVSLFRGFIPIAMRQVPYTVVKLVSFEWFAGYLCGGRLKPAQVSFCAGMCAGGAAAIVSQPADVLLTRVCGSAASTSLTECVVSLGLRDMVAYLGELGWRESFTGLGPRLAMVTCITGVQFLLYDSLRELLAREDR